MHRSAGILWSTKRERKGEMTVSCRKNMNVWNGHYYFIEMPFLCLKNLSCNGSTNTAHVKRKPRDRRWFKWERRAFAKTTCVTVNSEYVVNLAEHWHFSERSQSVKYGAQLALFFKLRTVCVCTALTIMNHNTMSQQFYNVNLNPLEKRRKCWIILFTCQFIEGRGVRDYKTHSSVCISCILDHFWISKKKKSIRVKLKNVLLCALCM